MSSPYIYERQSEYYTSRQVEDYLARAGFEVLTVPMLQYHEKSLPADYLHFAPSHTMLFGFQYKALYHNSKDYWPIDDEQHNVVIDYPWIYYCLSEMKSLSDSSTALQLALFVESFAISSGKLYSETTSHPMYSRWNTFFQAVEQCRKGIRVESRVHLDSLVSRLPRKFAEQLLDFFIPDFVSKRAVHFVPSLDFSDPRNSMYLPIIL